MTIAVLDGLRGGAIGRGSSCFGSVGSADCGRTMLVEITPTGR